MKPQVKILDCVLERLLKIKDCCFGKLYGISFKHTLIVLGLQIDIENGLNLVHSFPAEVDYCGVFEISEGELQQKKIIKNIHNIDVTDNPVVISVNLCATTNAFTCFVVCNEVLERVNYITTTEKEVYSEFIHIHLSGELPLKCEFDMKIIKECFQNFRKYIASGKIAFNLPKANVYLVGSVNENSVVGLNGDPALGDLYEESTEGCNKKKKVESFDMKILDMNIMKKNTKEDSNNERKGHAPVCILDKKQTTSLLMSMKIDSLALLHRETKFSKLYEILLESAIRYLRLLEKTFVNYLELNENEKGLSLPEAFHFYPSGCGHFLTRIFPVNEREEALKHQRELLHRQLMLETDMPLFRRANRYLFKAGNKRSGPLINPHEGLKFSDNGGHIALVKGKYEYYHYCQNNMDDNGWGCAYRSLQTLASWFKLQGYTDKDVPNYESIQKCLVDIGDKPSNFVGSRQWIGSTEVNFVLNTLLGITSKILYVSSGEEMGSKGPELLNHFEVNGSPIMIGGGVLAHTIIGVDYDQCTGNIMFLILDPHYTGDEDLHVIQNKGWCGWKKVDFWDKGAYYNMCMPQVPKEV